MKRMEIEIDIDERKKLFITASRISKFIDDIGRNTSPFTNATSAVQLGVSPTHVEIMQSFQTVRSFNIFNTGKYWLI